MKKEIILTLRIELSASEQNVFIGFLISYKIA